jgi:hypothetical protein
MRTDYPVSYHLSRIQAGGRKCPRYFQNPEFGLYLARLIVRRFEMNHGEAGTVEAGS